MKESLISNWSDVERTFEKQRESLINSIDLRQFIDDPFLFMRRQRFTDYLTRIKLFEKIKNVKGSIVECGVYKGGSLMLYYHLSSVLEPYASNRKIYGFDTFQGFRSISEKDDKSLNEEIFSEADYQIINKAIEVQDLNRAASHISKCKLIRGNAVETIPEFKKQHPELIIALLYLDFDIYEPTKVALEQFLPLVPKGGIVAFDELNVRKFMGETKAVKEILNLNEVKLEKFSFDPWPSYFCVGS